MLNFIDGNAMGHAHHRAMALTYRGMPTGGIFGYMGMLRKLRLENPAMKILVLWDGYAQARFTEFPDYKIDRAKKEATDPEEAKSREAYRAQVPIIKKVVTLLGITQMVHPDWEADDLAGLLVAATPGKPKTLTTGDEDWLQLLNPDTEWYDPRNAPGKRVRFHTFYEQTGYATPAEFLEGKALQGDSSDSIPGIPGVADKTAVKFIAEHRSVQAFFDKVDAGTYTPKARASKTAKSLTPEQILASPEGRQTFQRNMNLMDLRTPRVPFGEVQRTEGALNPIAVRTLCDRLGFGSYTRAFDNWIGPFVRPLVIEAQP